MFNCDKLCHPLLLHNTLSCGDAAAQPRSHLPTGEASTQTITAAEAGALVGDGESRWHPGNLTLNQAPAWGPKQALSEGRLLDPLLSFVGLLLPPNHGVSLLPF